MRRRLFTLFFVALAPLMSCSGGPKPRTVAPASAATRASTKAPTRGETLANAIETKLVPEVQILGDESYTTLQALMKELKVPAVSIAVFEQDKIVWAQAYGFVEQDQTRQATPETRFQAASISKPVNALTVLKVARAKALNLDAPVNIYLRSWKIPRHEWSATHPVTLRHLLTHTGGTTVHGFMGYPSGSPFPTTVQILSGQAPSNSLAVIVDQKPGESLRYSGGGSVISQLMLEDQIRRPYPEIAAKYTLKPLGMNQSSFDQPLAAPELSHAAAGHGRNGTVIQSKRNVYPELAAAGLWTTPKDLSTFLISVSKARRGQPSPVEPMIAKQMTTATPGIGNASMNIGLGPFLRTFNGHPMFGHAGSNAGFRCEMLASLDGGFGYAIMTNSDNGNALIQAISRTLLSQPGWPGGYEPLQRKPVPDAIAAAITGSYSTGGLDSISVERQGETYYLKRPFEPSHELVHLGKGRFVNRDTRVFIDSQDTGKTLRFSKDGEKPQQANRLGSKVLSPLKELQEGREDVAVKAWQDQHAQSDKKQLAAYEAQLNQLGYQLAGQQDLDAALTVLRFITRVRPKSSNAQDSLAEIHALRGERDLAIKHYEESLRLLEADPNADKATVASIRNRVQTTIDRLRNP